MAQPIRHRLSLLVALLLIGMTYVAPAFIARAAAQAAPVKVLPLGDSITDGYNIPGGYRIDLWASTQQAGQPVNFVGSLANGPASLGDKDHEGHSGYRIDQIQSGVNGWLDAAQPDVVLLMIGTNDMLQNYQVAGAPGRLGTLIDTITQRLPQARVIVASLPPLANAQANQRALNYNAAIPNLVSARAAAGARVSFLDMYPRLTLADLADGIHPNASGYSKLAAAWYGALAPFLPPPGSTLTPTNTPTRTLTPSPSPTPAPGSGSFFRAINLGGPATVVDGHPWDGSGAGNYSAAGTTQCNQWLTFTPAASAGQRTILSCWVQHWAHSLAVNSVPAGDYDVFIHVVQDWDNPSPASFTLAVEGQGAGGWTPGGAGSWARLGPFRRTVADGSISITASDLANIAGVEIWTAGGGTPPTATATASSTAVPPTATASSTAAPPTATATASSTAVPPTATATASSTAVPPTATATASSTAVPPTATASATPAASPTAGGASFYRAINLNGPAVTIGGNSWSAQTGAASFTANGTAMSNQWLALSPGTDAAGKAMLTAWRQHWAFSSAMSGVPAGTYQVYVYVVSDWNNPSPSTVTFRLEGASVGAYVQGAAGSWSKLGPYTAAISDGTINLAAEGLVNVAGVEVWRTN